MHSGVYFGVMCHVESKLWGDIKECEGRDEWWVFFPLLV